MKSAFILATLIFALSGVSHAEIWKCQKEGEIAASYTDTPIGGEGINCQKVETIRFTKTGEKQARAAASGSRGYSPPPAHVVSKVRSKVKAVSSAPKPARVSSTRKTGK